MRANVGPHVHVETIYERSEMMSAEFTEMMDGLIRAGFCIGNSIEGAGEDLRNAITGTSFSSNCMMSNGQHANVADGLCLIAKSIDGLAVAISSLNSVESHGHVNHEPDLRDGFGCPQCGTLAGVEVEDDSPSGKVTRHRRCPDCGLIFSTDEIRADQYRQPGEAD